MEPSVWEASQRKIFPWSLSLRNVIQIACFLIVAAGVAPIGKNDLLLDTSFLWLLGITLAISTVAYKLSDKFILAFKDTLCNRNMFGKDLNKLGEQKDKEKV